MYQKNYKDWKPPKSKPQRTQKVHDVRICHLCGGSGSVYRAFIEPQVGAQFAHDLVRCPRLDAHRQVEGVTNG